MEPELEDFASLYLRSYRLVARFIFQRVNDRELAEDLTAEAFARAFEKNQGGTRITVRWLLSTARNLVGNEYQRRARDQARIQRMITKELTEVATWEGDRDDVGLRIAMTRLRPADAYVLQLTYWEGLSAAEAANVIGCSTGALWVRLTRARATLRSLLVEEAASGATPNVTEGGLPKWTT